MEDPLSAGLAHESNLQNGGDTHDQAGSVAVTLPGNTENTADAGPAGDPAASSPAPVMQRSTTALSPLTRGASSPIPIAGVVSPPSPATPPAHGPPDPLDAGELDALMQKASPVRTPAPRFSLAHITRNLEIHKAARRELDGSQGAVASQGSGPKNASLAGSDVGSCLDGLGHDAEVERQRAAIKAIDEDVAAESKVNREMSGLVVEHMEDGRRALEGLLCLITAMAAAEHAYSAAMAAAAVKLRASTGPSTNSSATTTRSNSSSHTSNTAMERSASSSSHSMTGGVSARANGSSCNEGMRPVAQALLPLPKALAEAHGQLEAKLIELGDGVRQLQEEYQRCGKDISSTATALHRGIDAGRHSLGKAFQEHKAVCEAFDLAAAERPRSRAFIRSPDQDPWATEGKLVQEHKALQGWQDRERDFLKGAFARAEALETRRLQLTRSAVECIGSSYSAVLQQLPGRIGWGPAAAPAGAEGAANGVPEGAAGATTVPAGDGGGLLFSEAAEAGLAGLRRVAVEAAKMAEALAARQAESIEGVCQELFCSPEIIRQGEMSHWNARSSTWTVCHFVLTRAGFLHWFASMEEVHALDLLNLAKCQFEAGEAPIFNIVEGGSNSWLTMRSGRRATFKASTIEECCEWAIALREAIALASSRHQRSSHNSNSGSMNGR